MLAGERRERFVLLLELHAQRIADEDHRGDDADHAQRIGHRIAQCDRRIVDARGVGVSLLCGAEARGVGNGAREHAHHRRDRRPGGDVDRIGHGHAEQHDRRSAADELQAALLERGEKARADLKADREDEENQSELLDEMEHVAVDGHAEMAERDAHEEHPRDAERDAADLHPAEQDADGDGQRERQDGMGDAAAEKERVEPLHMKSRFCVG